MTVSAGAQFPAYNTNQAGEGQDGVAQQPGDKLETIASGPFDRLSRGLLGARLSLPRRRTTANIGLKCFALATLGLEYAWARHCLRWRLLFINDLLIRHRITLPPFSQIPAEFLPSAGAG